MSNRNLQDALTRAENLRDFAKTNQAAFEKSVDWQDIVILADRVAELELDTGRKTAMLKSEFDTFAEREDDHDESW